MIDLETPKQLVTKAAYAAVGAPVVIGRRIKDLGAKVADQTQAQYEVFADEGAKVAKQLQKRNVVEELEQRIHLDKVQDRVDKLRDQLEQTLHSWRDSFVPGETESENAAADAVAKEAPEKKAATKPATKAKAKKAPAKSRPAGKPASK
jgi:hypothetical protein